eukprot:2862188-Rhodomonas_salina.1
MPHLSGQPGPLYPLKFACRATTTATSDCTRKVLAEHRLRRRIIMAFSCRILLPVARLRLPVLGLVLGADRGVRSESGSAGRAGERLSA